MSQFFLNSVNGPIPPQVPTTFNENTGTATPAANILNIVGGTTTALNNNGITTVGAGNTVTVELTNRAQGVLATADATPTALVTLPLGSTPGVYTFDCLVAGFNATGPLGAGFTIVGSVRTTGAAAVLIPNQAIDHFEEGALGNPPEVDAEIVVSGNNAILQVTGQPGVSINWNGVMNYIFVS